MNRAYSLLTVKAVKEDERIISGVATTPTPDRMGDIVDPLGVKFRNPMPLLHQHRNDEPVGMVRFDKPTKDGITFEAKLPQIEDPGPLKDRVDTAWGEVKAGLVRAVSIGFRPLEYSIMEDGGYRYVESEVVELSLVTIPAQAEAIITTVKSFDKQFRDAAGIADEDHPTEDQSKAATGKQTRVVRLNAPAGVSAKPFVINKILRTT
jgi:HK97 family phage prohead protease